MNWNEFIKKALSEKNGQPSSIRVFNGWALFWFVLIISFGFVFVVIAYEGLIIAYLGVIAGVVVAVLGLKVGQKWKENNETN
jgi:hypothetical protein